MKIYSVSFIGMDDNTYTEYFANKIAATKRHHALDKKSDKILDDYEYEENEALCKQSFGVHETECSISRKGILDYLNAYCAEQ